MLRLSQSGLHTEFANALRSAVTGISALGRKPLDLDLRPPLPPRTRLYLYNATHPPGERSEGDRKIQLIVPGQRAGMRGDFDFSDGRFVLLSGYDNEAGVFVLWDADLYRAFSFSRNVQVKRHTVLSALAGGVVEQDRYLWSGATDIVLAATADHLGAAILRRVDLKLARLTS